MQTEDIEGYENLTQAIAHIQNTATAAKREATITLADGRVFLYDDRDQKYTEIDRFVKFEGAVSTVESFAELVAEYAKRFKRADGAKQTVTFTGVGATYSPDDDDRRHLFTYKRVLSQQWLALKTALGKPMSHKDLIRALQTLSPSIVDYPLVMASFRRLVVSKDIRMTSEPILNDSGDSTNGYNVNLSLKGGTTETTLPSSITVKVQYARGSEATYEIPVEVDLTEKEGIPIVTLFAPLIDAIADQAVMDEMKSFHEAMERTGLKELLVVVSF
jgi:hypothetical protein